MVRTNATSWLDKDVASQKGRLLFGALLSYFIPATWSCKRWNLLFGPLLLLVIKTFDRVFYYFLSIQVDIKVFCNRFLTKPCGKSLPYPWHRPNRTDPSIYFAHVSKHNGLWTEGFPNKTGASLSSWLVPMVYQIGTCTVFECWQRPLAS